MKEDELNILLEKYGKSSVLIILSVIENQLTKNKSLVVKDVHSNYIKLCNKLLIKKALDNHSTERLLNDFTNSGLIQTKNDEEIVLVAPLSTISKMEEINKELAVFKFFR